MTHLRRNVEIRIDLGALPIARQWTDAQKIVAEATSLSRNDLSWPEWSMPLIGSQLQLIPIYHPHWTVGDWP